MTLRRFRSHAFLGFMGTGELGITTRKPVEDQTFGPVRGSTWSEVEGQR